MKYAALGLAVFLASSTALANGRYPQSGAVIVDPENPQHLLVRTTYGVLVTSDHGATWNWICEPSIGYPASSSEDPSFGIVHGGTLLAGLFEGLTISTDAACSFVPYKAFDMRYVVDLAVDKSDPTKAVLVFSSAVSGAMYATQFWETTDSAMTWTQAGVALPTDFIALTIDTAPSDPNRVYVSGRLGAPTYAGVVERSDDRGATWASLPVAGADVEHLPYVGAVDPTNPDRLYARLDSDHVDQILYSDDGAMTWTSAFSSQGNLWGFALSPDGSQVATGGDEDGIWIAPTATMKFVKASTVGSYCLAWAAEGLYTCARDAIAGFEVGLSSNQANTLTFTPVLHLSELCNGPLKCPAGTTTQEQCPDLWGNTTLSLGLMCGSGGASASATTASAATTGAGGGSGGAPATGSSSGGCAVGDDGGDATLAIGAVAALLVISRRRRRA